MNALPRHRRIFLATLTSVLGFAGAANASESIYMAIPGVTGTVTAVGFVGTIEIFSYSQGFTNANGTAICSDTAVQKQIDQSSAFFAKSVLEQRGPFNATIYFVEDVNGKAVATTTVKLKSAVVTTVQHGATTGGGPISESISMHAASLVVTFNNNGVMQTYTTTCP